MLNQLGAICLNQPVRTLDKEIVISGERCTKPYQVYNSLCSRLLELGVTIRPLAQIRCFSYIYTQE